MLNLMKKRNLRIALPKDSPELLKHLNQTIDEVKSKTQSIVI